MVNCAVFVFFIIVSLPCQCPGTSEKVCNCFLPARDNDPRRLCSSCRGKECNIDDRCVDCHDWDNEMWRKVSDYHAKVAVQKERKAKAASSPSSFPGFLSSVPVPLCELSSSSIDSAVVTFIAFSYLVRAVAFTSSLLIVSVQLFDSPSVEIVGPPTIVGLAYSSAPNCFTSPVCVSDP